MKPVIYDYYVKNLFRLNLISTGDVINVLSNLNESKSCGHDKISAKILKDSSELTAPILTSMYADDSNLYMVILQTI